MTQNELIGKIAECLEEALRLQSRVTEVRSLSTRMRQSGLKFSE
jgi:hypothetical protein